MMDMMRKIKLRQTNFGGVCWKKLELIFKKIPTTISGKFPPGLAFPPLLSCPVANAKRSATGVSPPQFYMLALPARRSKFILSVVKIKSIDKE